MQSTNQELVKLWANADKRSAFLKSYKNWGCWLTVPELGLTYYRYDLPNNARILVMEYQRLNPYPINGEGKIQTLSVYYLWEGEHFVPSPASEYQITNRLKELKMELQKELCAETDL
jgi:hypothetical protein